MEKEKNKALKNKILIFFLGIFAVIMMGCGVDEAEGATLRLEDIGKGTAPAFVAVGHLPITPLQVGFGFASADGSYLPKFDLTFEKEGVFGRIGSDFEFNPAYSLGYKSAIAEWFGFEATYTWEFEKVGDELEYSQVGDGGTIGLNLWASF
jgi:hypothetical protein